jgi:hypothetical protein
VCPHTDDFYGFDVIKDLVDESMLDIDSPGTSAREIADQPFKGRWRAIRVLSKNGEEAFSLWLQA